VAGRRRVGSSVLRGRGSGPGARRGRRSQPRDSRGRFRSTGAAPSTAGGPAPDDRKRTHRRAAAGAVVAVGVVAASQTRPASRSRTTVQRRRIVNRHVSRAAADHARQVSRRNRVFPTEAMRPARFDAKAARAEGRKLTSGYRKQVKTLRKRARKSRR
jgi:hypothetical protein